MGELVRVLRRCDRYDESFEAALGAYEELDVNECADLIEDDPREAFECVDRARALLYWALKVKW